MSEGERSLWKETTIAVLVAIGTGALFKFSPDLALWLRVLLGAVIIVCFVAIVCLLATLQRLRELAQNLGKSLAGLFKHWRLLLVLGIGILLGLLVSRPPGPPRDVVNARREVREVERALEKAEIRTVTRPDGTGSEVWHVKGFMPILVEPPSGRGKLFKVYLKDGEKIAEDLLGDAPDTFERKYYRAECNFATDHFYGSGVHAYLEYYDGCRGGPPQIFEPETPFLPVPVFSYR